MNNLEQQKLNAAHHAAERFLRPRQTVGLGGGSTVRKFIDVISELKAKNSFVVADEKNKAYAKKKRLRIISLSDIKKIDIAFDGADGVDSKFNLIKGAGGGAVSHEKIIDSMAKTTIIMIDSTKLRKDLFKLEVPIEVIFDAAGFVTNELKRLGASARLKKEGGKAFLTDHGNYILNAKFSRRHSLAQLEKMIKDIPGVVESGIFTDIADQVIVGYDNHAEVLR